MVIRHAVHSIASPGPRRVEQQLKVVRSRVYLNVVSGAEWGHPGGLFRHSQRWQYRVLSPLLSCPDHFGVYWQGKTDTKLGKSYG